MEAGNSRGLPLRLQLASRDLSHPNCDRKCLQGGWTTLREQVLFGVIPVVIIQVIATITRTNSSDCTLIINATVRSLL